MSKVITIDQGMKKVATENWKKYLAREAANIYFNLLFKNLDNNNIENMISIAGVLSSYSDEEFARMEKAFKDHLTMILTKKLNKMENDESFLINEEGLLLPSLEFSGLTIDLSELLIDVEVINNSHPLNSPLVVKVREEVKEDNVVPFRK